MSGPVTVVYWCGSQRVFTLPELDGLLDAVTAVGGPGWVEIVSADDRSILGVTVGSSGPSPLRFTSGDVHQIWRSADIQSGRNNDTSPDGGPLSSLDSDSEVTADTARAAIREFFQTPRPPTCVPWRHSDR